MAPTTRLNAGSIVVVALVVLVGAALVVGPAVAQETTDDGMSGNETMDDERDENESMSDEETMDDGMDENESMGDDMGTETMADDSMTEEEMMDEGGDEQMDDETASGGQPGFGVAVALAALVVAAAFVLYRRRG